MLSAAQNNNVNIDSKHNDQKTLSSNQVLIDVTSSEGFKIAAKYLKPEWQKSPAHIFWLGLDFEKDCRRGQLEEAFELFKTAADLGSYEAMFEVGLKYLKNASAGNIDSSDGISKTNLAIESFRRYNRAVMERRQNPPAFSFKSDPDLAEIKLYDLYLSLKKSFEYDRSNYTFLLLQTSAILKNEKSKEGLVDYLWMSLRYDGIDRDFLQQYVAQNYAIIAKELNRDSHQHKKIVAECLVYQVKKTAKAGREEVFRALNEVYAYNRGEYYSGRHRDKENRTLLMHAVIEANYHALEWLEDGYIIKKLNDSSHEDCMVKSRMLDAIFYVKDNKGLSAYDYAFMYANLEAESVNHIYPQQLESFPEVQKNSRERMCFDWCWFRVHTEMRRKNTAHVDPWTRTPYLSYADTYHLQLETDFRYIQLAVRQKNIYFLHKIFDSYPHSKIETSILTEAHKQDFNFMIQLMKYINKTTRIKDEILAKLNDSDHQNRENFFNDLLCCEKSYLSENFVVIAILNYVNQYKHSDMVNKVMGYFQRNYQQCLILFGILTNLGQDEKVKKILLSQIFPLLSTLCYTASREILIVFLDLLIKIGAPSVDIMYEIMQKCYEEEVITSEYAYRVYHELIKKNKNGGLVFDMMRCKKSLRKGLRGILIESQSLNMQHLTVVLIFLIDTDVIIQSDLFNKTLMQAYFADKITAQQLNEIYTLTHQLMKRLNNDEKNQYAVWVSPLIKEFPYRSYTSLLAIVAKGDMKALEDYLVGNKDIILQTEKECDENKPSRLLIVAVYFGHFDIVKRLLREGIYIKYEENRRTVCEYISQLNEKEFDFVGIHNNIRLDREQLNYFLNAYEAVILGRLPVRIHENLKNLFESNLEDFLVCFPEKKEYLRAIAHGEFEQAKQLKQPEIVYLMTPSAPPLSQRSVASPRTTQSRGLPKPLIIPTTSALSPVSVSSVNLGMFTPKTLVNDEKHEVLLPGVVSLL